MVNSIRIWVLLYLPQPSLTNIATNFIELYSSPFVYDAPFASTLLVYDAPYIKLTPTDKHLSLIYVYYLLTISASLFPLYMLFYTCLRSYSSNLILVNYCLIKFNVLWAKLNSNVYFSGLLISITKPNHLKANLK